MLWQKGFTWPPYPSSGLCEPATDSWAVLELYHFRMANTLSPMMDSHSSPLLSEMPAPEGSPLGPSPHLLSPRSIQQMPPPCVVSSHSTPPPIYLPYFPVYPGVANALSPCCLGRGAGHGLSGGLPLPGGQQMMCKTPGNRPSTIHEWAE